MLSAIVRKVALGKPVLKDIRWLLLKNPDNLDDTRNERQRLNEVLKLNEPSAQYLASTG